jgi:predicted nucleic acid-binding protein
LLKTYIRYQKIDKGEAEAIALFSSMEVDFLLVDDLKGRRQAKAMGLPVAGTLGILIAAKRKGLISEISAVLEILKQHRFYVSDEVLKRALILAGETKE